jgi:hypothetical protein
MKRNVKLTVGLAAGGVVIAGGLLSAGSVFASETDEAAAGAKSRQTQSESQECSGRGGKSGHAGMGEGMGDHAGEGKGMGDHAGEGKGMGDHAGEGKGEHAGMGEGMGDHAGEGKGMGDHAGEGKGMGDHAGEGKGMGDHAGEGKGEHAGMGEGMGDHAGEGKGEHGGITAESGTLTDAQKATLVTLAEEEKLAYDLYTSFADRYDTKVFDHISQSECHHLDVMRTLLDRYKIDDPTEGQKAGSFADEKTQKTYDRLLKQGEASEEKALKAGRTVERADVNDLTKAFKGLDAPDVEQVYERLIKMSEKQLEAFERQLDA